jgi:2-polyprenyl-3-methyl-5-hydroxy-6-metoxy-1,4-benzoquinol methylase
MQQNLTNNYTNPTFWNNSYSKIEFRTLENDNPLTEYIKKYFPKTDRKKLLELGCYPGTYSSIFGELGYELNGIDYAEGVETELKNSYIQRGFRVGDLIKEDIFKTNYQKEFDVVASFGLIEHFEDFLSVIDLHDKFLKKGGELFITVPNFKFGLQGFIHKTIDQKNLSVHNLEAMDPKLWKEHLESNGYTIVNYGFTGQFRFWVDDQERTIIEKIILKSLLKTKALLTKIFPSDNKNFAPYAYIHCIKK